MDSSLLATIILGAVGVAITLYYSWHSKKLAHEQLQKELFKEFNERYSRLNDFLVTVEREAPTLHELELHNEKEILKQKVIDYFSLCAEEFYWYHHKERIDQIIWTSWHSGMNYWYKHVPAIKDLWKKEIAANGPESYYITNGNEFFTEETEQT